MSLAEPEASMYLIWLVGLRNAEFENPRKSTFLQIGGKIPQIYTSPLQYEECIV